MRAVPTILGSSSPNSSSAIRAALPDLLRLDLVHRTKPRYAIGYLIADANGLAGDASAGSALVAGTSLVIPNKPHNVHNSASTFRVYDPNEALGETAPNTPAAVKPPKKHGGCGGFGQILLTIVAVALVLKVPLTNLIAFGVPRRSARRAPSAAHRTRS